MASSVGVVGCITLESEFRRYKSLCEDDIRLEIVKLIKEVVRCFLRIHPNICQNTAQHVFDVLQQIPGDPLEKLMLLAYLKRSSLLNCKYLVKFLKEINELYANRAELFRFLKMGDEDIQKFDSIVCFAIFMFGYDSPLGSVVPRDIDLRFCLSIEQKEIMLASNCFSYYRVVTMILFSQMSDLRGVKRSCRDPHLSLDEIPGLPPCKVRMVEAIEDMDY